MKAFYFARESRTLRYGDERPVIVGETHTVDCKPKVCEIGLHGSIRPLDALKYAPGTILYLVDIDGDLDIGTDKIAGTQRKYIAEFDARPLLIRFACDCALDNIKLIKPYTDKYDLIVDFLKNPTARAAYAAA